MEENKVCPIMSRPIRDGQGTFFFEVNCDKERCMAWDAKASYTTDKYVGCCMLINK